MGKLNLTLIDKCNGQFYCYLGDPFKTFEGNETEFRDLTYHVCVAKKIKFSFKQFLFIINLKINENERNN